MKVAINYADYKFKKEQSYNTKTAYSKGKFDKVIEYSPNNIDNEFKKKYRNILEQKRGGGYWLWKPYIINKALSELAYGDYLFYCDSAAYYINSIDHLVKCLEENKQDIMIFDLPLVERCWTKMDTFVLMDCYKKEYLQSNQRLASFILIKKNKFSIDFINKYLDYCCNEFILTDKDNICGKLNDVFFLDHRHDQSVLSLLSKKYKIRSFRDPSQFGFNPEIYKNALYSTIIDKGAKFDIEKLYNPQQYNISDYPQILVHYRKKNALKQKIKYLIPKNILNIYKVFKRKFIDKI